MRFKLIWTNWLNHFILTLNVKFFKTSLFFFIFIVFICPSNSFKFCLHNSTCEYKWTIIMTFLDSGKRKIQDHEFMYRLPNINWHPIFFYRAKSADDYFFLPTNRKADSCLRRFSYIYTHTHEFICFAQIAYWCILMWEKLMELAPVWSTRIELN